MKNFSILCLLIFILAGCASTSNTESRRLIPEKSSESDTLLLIPISTEVEDEAPFRGNYGVLTIGKKNVDKIENIQTVKVEAGKDFAVVQGLPAGEYYITRTSLDEYDSGESKMTPVPLNLEQGLCTISSAEAVLSLGINTISISLNRWGDKITNEDRTNPAISILQTYETDLKDWPLSNIGYYHYTYKRYNMIPNNDFTKIIYKDVTDPDYIRSPASPNDSVVVFPVKSEIEKGVYPFGYYRLLIASQKDDFQQTIASVDVHPGKDYSFLYGLNEGLYAVIGAEFHYYSGKSIYDKDLMIYFKVEQGSLSFPANYVHFKIRESGISMGMRDSLDGNLQYNYYAYFQENHSNLKSWKYSNHGVIVEDGKIMGELVRDDLKHNTLLLIPTFTQNDSGYDYAVQYMVSIIDRATSEIVRTFPLIPEEPYSLVRGLPPGEYAFSMFIPKALNNQNGYLYKDYKGEFHPFDIMADSIVSTEYAYRLTLKEYNYEGETKPLYDIEWKSFKGDVQIERLKKYFEENPDSPYYRDEIIIGLILDDENKDSKTIRSWNPIENTTTVSVSSSFSIEFETIEE